MDDSDDDRRATNLAAFEAVLGTFAARDAERLAQHMTDDLVFEMPYGPASMPNPMVGRAAWCDMQRMTFEVFRSSVFELVRSYPCVDPDELIVEYRSQAVVERNGNEYRNSYIGVLRFREGRISHWREYHNPEATSVL